MTYESSIWRVSATTGFGRAWEGDRPTLMGRPKTGLGFTPRACRSRTCGWPPLPKGLVWDGCRSTAKTSSASSLASRSRCARSRGSVSDLSAPCSRPRPWSVMVGVSVARSTKRSTSTATGRRRPGWIEGGEYDGQPAALFRAARAVHLERGTTHPGADHVAAPDGAWSPPGSTSGDVAGANGRDHAAHLGRDAGAADRRVHRVSARALSDSQVVVARAALGRQAPGQTCRSASGQRRSVSVAQPNSRRVRPDTPEPPSKTSRACLNDSTRRSTRSTDS